MELLEVQLTTAEGQVAVFNFTVERLNDLAPQLHALAKVGLFEVCVREWRGKVWSVIDGEPCGCEDCLHSITCEECQTQTNDYYFTEGDNRPVCSRCYGWTFTPHKDISFEHCGRPAYWQNEKVICTKCQEVLPEN